MIYLSEKEASQTLRSRHSTTKTGNPNDTTYFMLTIRLLPKFTKLGIIFESPKITHFSHARGEPDDCHKETFRYEADFSQLTRLIKLESGLDVHTNENDRESSSKQWNQYARTGKL